MFHWRCSTKINVNKYFILDALFCRSKSPLCMYTGILICHGKYLKLFKNKGSIAICKQCQRWCLSIHKSSNKILLFIVFQLLSIKTSNHKY